MRIFKIRKKILFITLIFILPSILSLFSLVEFNMVSIENNEQLIFDDSPKMSGSWTEINIWIDDNDVGVRDWATKEAGNPWCSGAGTFSNPYVIENVTITGDFLGIPLRIDNSIGVYFIIRNVTATSSDDANPLFGGISLTNVSNGYLINNNLSTNAGSGIVLDGSYNNTIEGNILNENDYHGIMLSDDSDNNTISTNTITNNSVIGIYLNMNNTANIIENNQIDGQSTQSSGIALSASSSNNVIRNNTIKNNKFEGIIFTNNCSDNLITQNLIFSNGREGIQFDGQFGPLHRNTISQNKIYDNNLGGIRIGSLPARPVSEGNKIIGNNIMNNGLSGVNLEGWTNSSLIIGNSITENDHDGVYLWRGNNHTVINNTISKNKYHGIYVQYALNTHYITKNVVNSNEREGISIWMSDNLVISANTVHSNNYNGIKLFDSNFNTITGNIISYNNISGILCDQSEDNVISGNIFDTNIGHGISLQESNDNIVTVNIISNNQKSGIHLLSSNYTLVSYNTLYGNSICINETSSVGNLFQNNTCFKTLYVVIIEEIFTVDEFIITLKIIDGDGNNIEGATIQVWWDGDDVSTSMEEMGNGLYNITLDAILVGPDDPPILLNFSISSSGYENLYYELEISVDPIAVSVAKIAGDEPFNILSFFMTPAGIIIIVVIIGGVVVVIIIIKKKK